MQDPAIFQTMNMNPQFPDQQEQHLKCPRCDSNNTKFCYYNNYNLSQPRHFCKNCRRYWTKGGALRNIPVGGGTRKNTTKRPSKRSTSSSSAMQKSDSGHDPGKIYGSGSDLEVGGGGVSFSSLLASNGGFGGVFEGLHSDGSGLKIEEMGGIGENLTPGLGLDMGRARDPGMEEEVERSNGSESFLGLQNGDSGCWSGGGNGWPDLAIYTPGSSFQ